MFHWCVEIVWAVFAGLGGLAKALHEVLKGKEQFAWPRILARIIVSGFSGLMVAKATSIMDPNWTTVAAGVGGFLGAEAIDYLVVIVKGRLPKQPAAAAADSTDADADV